MNNYLIFIIVILLNINIVIPQSTEVTLPLLDKRYVTYVPTSDNYTGPTAGFNYVGVEIQSGSKIIYRTANTWNPNDIADWAFITSGTMRIETISNPNQTFTLNSRPMRSDPRGLSKEGLYADCGNDNIYFSVNIPDTGITTPQNLPTSFLDDVEYNLEEAWTAAGFHSNNEANESNTLCRPKFDLLKVTQEIRMSTSGTLTQEERWGGSHTLTGDVQVPETIYLTLWKNANINLNSYKVTSPTGYIVRQANVTLTPDINLKYQYIKGLYSDLNSALNAASTGDTVLVGGTLQLNADVVVASGKILKFAENAQIYLQNHYIKSTGGTLLEFSSTDFYPDIRLTQGTIKKGYFPSTATAMAHASSNDRVDINSGESWNSNFTVVCDILINPSGEVTIPAAKTILFDPDSRLTVRGELIINGQYGANKVYLRAVPGNTWSRGIWDGIWIENGGVGILNHACIYNADYGLNLSTGSSVEANNCYIQNNYYGIYGNNANYCQLQQCLIFSNSTAAITAYPLNFNMGNCQLKYNGDGIQSQSSYPEIWYTQITLNTRGVVASGGVIDMGASTTYKGYNSIYNNSSYEMDVFPYAFIWAIGNYWGGGQPTDIHYNNGGNVIWWPVLPYPPLNKNQFTTNEQLIPTLAKPKPVDNAILADPLSLIMPAIELRKNKDYAAAASSLEAIIYEYPQSEAALAALWELARTYHKANTDSPGVKFASNLSATLSRMLPNFKSSKSEVHSQLYPTALKLLTHNYMQTNTPNSAIETCQQLIKEFPGTSFEEEGWWSLFNTYYFLLADTSQAKSCYEQLKQNFPKSEFLVHAYHALDLDDVQPFVKEQLDAEIPPPTPVKYYLSSAYPNPFNSSTSIKYDLPESDQVSLKIYNIEGKLVTELVNKTQPAGTYQVLWDGKNSQQEAVTSGIYFCQFKTRQYWQTVRVILLR